MYPKTDGEIEMMTRISYASSIGSIMYGMISTRSGVAYALSVASRYQANTDSMHWNAVKDILNYLRRTKSLFMIYGDDSKSIYVSVSMLNGANVSWKRSKQDTVADSITEAGYIDASAAAKEAVWMRNFVQ
ncbi:secreted RxLR effector protein 161-like [Primulina tabacum]|uniref:secreted RxLR effector protein 161-like n=1 Tax=Primulina tabacum TaxID=48773 RepID=UPI003F59B771